MTTRQITFSIPTAREQLASLGLAPQEIEQCLQLVVQKYGDVNKLTPGPYSVELLVQPPPPVSFTNQQMITAIYNLAREQGQDGWNLLSRAGLTSLIRDRQAIYSGPAIESLSGLTPQERVRLGMLLGVSVPVLTPPTPDQPTAPDIIWSGPTDNRYTGRAGHAINWIVIHYTASGSGQGVLSWFKNPSARVSAHYVLDRDGTIYQVVKDEDTAWHAGLAARSGLSDEENAKRRDRDAQLYPNRRGIGIEIVNWGLLRRDGDNYFTWFNDWSTPYNGEVIAARERYWATYTEQQYNKLISLVSFLCKKYEVPAQFPAHGPGAYHAEISDLKDFSGLLGHEAIDNTKTDPGGAFDWERLRQGLQSS
jgi:N-acetyl-anhydromuramyl-L-alanine amidase AmpD